MLPKFFQTKPILLKSPEAKQLPGISTGNPLLSPVRWSLVVIIFCLWLSTNYMAFASCWGCFTLRGVKVKLTNGQTVSGYVRWNPEWFTENNKKASFPGSLFQSKHSKEWGDPLIIYKNVYPINKPFKDLKLFEKNFRFLITSEADIIRIPLKDLKDIMVEPKKHDGYSGAGEIPVFSKDLVTLMTDETPVAVLANDSNVSLELFISYNKNVGEGRLKERFEEYQKGKWTSIETFLAELHKDRIILLEIAFD